MAQPAPPIDLCRDFQFSAATGAPLRPLAGTSAQQLNTQNLPNALIAVAAAVGFAACVMSALYILLYTCLRCHRKRKEREKALTVGSSEVRY